MSDIPAQFQEILDLEADYRRARATEAFGVDAATRQRAKRDKDYAWDQLVAIASTLSPEENAKYGLYRHSGKRVQ